MSTTPPPPPRTRLHRLRWSIVAVVAMSCVINLLALTGAIYMLQVYDRVLTSQSVPTLVVLSLLVVGLYLIYGVLDVVRGQVLLRVGNRIDVIAMPLAHEESVRRNLDGRPAHEAVEPIRDVDTVRNVLAGPAPIAVADLPWTPIFFMFVALLSPTLGLVTALGMGLLVVIAIITDRATRHHEVIVATAAQARAHEMDATLRSSEALAAMGMGPDASHRFLLANARLTDHQQQSGDMVMLLGGLSRVIRLMLQSAILGLGAYLAIRGDITAGAIVAASITAARALGPVEQAITNWRVLAQARVSWLRLKQLLATPQPPTAVVLPLPRRSLALENIAVRAPGSPVVTLGPISFQLAAGQGLAIVGSSGSGKSTLARAIAGVWSPIQGAVRLDSAPIDRWDRADRGAFIGYMPQHVDVFPTTVAENIARLEVTPDPKALIAAAEAAGIHDVIVNLPRGYETVLAPGGAPLSAGQRQQIGLARALYGDPFLVVLDEPNANLDQQGEDALVAALASVTARGGIVVVVAHRRSVLAAISTVAVIDAGRLKAFGPKAEVLNALAARHPTASEPRVTALDPNASKRRQTP